VRYQRQKKKDKRIINHKGHQEHKDVKRETAGGKREREDKRKITKDKIKPKRLKTVDERLLKITLNPHRRSPIIYRPLSLTFLTMIFILTLNRFFYLLSFFFFLN